jgi:hypothetical protein
MGTSAEGSAGALTGRITVGTAGLGNRHASQSNSCALLRPTVQSERTDAESLKVI